MKNSTRSILDTMARTLEMQERLAAGSRERGDLALAHQQEERIATFRARLEYLERQALEREALNYVQQSDSAD